MEIGRLLIFLVVSILLGCLSKSTDDGDILVYLFDSTSVRVFLGQPETTQVVGRLHVDGKEYRRVNFIKTIRIENENGLQTKSVQIEGYLESGPIETSGDTITFKMKGISFGSDSSGNELDMGSKEVIQLQDGLRGKMVFKENRKRILLINPDSTIWREYNQSHIQDKSFLMFQ